MFNDGCAKLTLSIISDHCQERIALFANEFTLHERKDSDDCLSAGSVLNAHFSESATWPRISGDAATYVFGMLDFVYRPDVPRT